MSRFRSSQKHSVTGQLPYKYPLSERFLSVPKTMNSAFVSYSLLAREYLVSLGSSSNVSASKISNHIDGVLAQIDDVSKILFWVNLRTDYHVQSGTVAYPIIGCNSGAAEVNPASGRGILVNTPSWSDGVICSSTQLLHFPFSYTGLSLRGGLSVIILCRTNSIGAWNRYWSFGDTNSNFNLVNDYQDTRNVHMTRENTSARSCSVSWEPGAYQMSTTSKSISIENGTDVGISFATDTDGTCVIDSVYDSLYAARTDHSLGTPSRLFLGGSYGTGGLGGSNLIIKGFFVYRGYLDSTKRRAVESAMSA